MKMGKSSHTRGGDATRVLGLTFRGFGPESSSTLASSPRSHLGGILNDLDAGSVRARGGLCLVRPKIFQALPGSAPRLPQGLVKSLEYARFRSVVLQRPWRSSVAPSGAPLRRPSAKGPFPGVSRRCHSQRTFFTCIRKLIPPRFARVGAEQTMWAG